MYPKLGDCGKLRLRRVVTTLVGPNQDRYTDAKGCTLLGRQIVMRCIGGTFDGIKRFCAVMVVCVAIALAAQGLSAATETPDLANSDTPAPVAAADPVPLPPVDARAAKAYAVLDGYCARCHQTGRLKVPAPARPLANILALDEIALEPTLIKPGVPDASPLYTIMLRQHATVDLEEAPRADAIQSVRDWILDLPQPAQNCGGRRAITQAEVDQAAAASLMTTPEEKRKDIRFITLSHLANACVSPEALAGYRQAITKVINTLSWGPEPIRLDTVDPDATVLKLDLGELGWVAAHWEKLIQAQPYATLASARLSESVRRMTATPMPAVRGDWFAHAAMSAPLYPRLLGLPGRLANLQRILNVDIESNIKAAKARRAGITTSLVTRANRLIERHPTRTGSLWLTYDFATSEGRQSLVANPLGPAATPIFKVPFKHDGSKAIFTLPNGFLAFSLNDARGDRIDVSPDAIERDELWMAGPVANGASCMACHRAGPMPIKDVIRSGVEADTGAPKELRDMILALYAPASEMDTLIAEDQERYAMAQRKAGIDPNLLINGLEPVTALAREYMNDVGLARLAAEVGLTMAETADRIARLPVELSISGRRVLAATASRAEADRILIRLAPDGGAPEAAVKLDTPLEPRTDFELLLWSRSTTYQSGDLATFHARSNQDCYLTVVSLDRGGQATVLFPNEFEQNNLLAASKDLTLPSEGAAYQFRLRDKGRETLVGICQTGSKAPQGLQHDFERQRFTMLGDWRAHLAQAPLPSGRAQSTPEPVRSRPQRVTRTKPVVTTAPAGDTKGGPDLQARTAITYEIR